MAGSYSGRPTCVGEVPSFRLYFLRVLFSYEQIQRYIHVVSVVTAEFIALSALAACLMPHIHTQTLLWWCQISQVTQGANCLIRSVLPRTLLLSDLYFQSLTTNVELWTEQTINYHMCICQRNVGIFPHLLPHGNTKTKNLRCCCAAAVGEI